MRKTTLVTLQGKKAMCHAECIVLTNSQYKKLTCDELAKRVDGLAKDFHVDWSVEGNENANIINISRTTTATIDDAFCHKLEMDATNFMSAIDKLELPKLEPECPSHEDADEEEKAQDAKTLEFVKTLLHDINLPSDNDSHVCGALVIDRTTHPLCPELTGWGHISYDLLKEMCELYLNNHK